MPNILKRLDGVINNIFSIGLKDNKTHLTSTASALSVDNNIDVGDYTVKSNHIPTADNDVVNLSYVKQQNANSSHVYYYDFTDTVTVLPTTHKIGVENGAIIKHVVLDVLEAYDSDATITVSFGQNELISSSDINLNTVCQYQDSTFNVFDTTGDLTVTVLNATTVGKVRIYIEYVNL